MATDRVSANGPRRRRLGTGSALCALLAIGCSFDKGGISADPLVDAGREGGSVSGLPTRGLPVGMAPPVTIRINVNGPALPGVSNPGPWAADPGLQGVCGPSAYRNGMPIQGTEDDLLFQGGMFGNPLICAVGGGTLPAGPYQVNLYFAEVYWGPGCPGGGPGLGARRFDIRMEAALAAENVDLYREAGCAASALGLGKPIVKRFTTSITDGTLDLRFDATIDNANIAAIELISDW